MNRIKRVYLKFASPLDWEEAKKLDLGVHPLHIVYVGRVHTIEGIKCFESEFEKVASNLKKKKVAFKLDK